jgi:hypothetical protein
MSFGWELVVLHTPPFMLVPTWRCEQGTFYIGLLRVKLRFLACEEVRKRVWPSSNQNRLLFTQIHTLAPSSTHHKVERKLMRATNYILQQKVPLNLFRMTLISTLLEDRKLVH